VVGTPARYGVMLYSKADAPDRAERLQGGGMASSARVIEDWVSQARARLRDGSLGETDLDNLLNELREGSVARRQRLLYLQATTPSIRSQVIGMALHEPVRDAVTQITATAEWPYATVHDAILDGWQVVHFPQQRVPFDDRDIDVLGYEFILQKMEEV